MAAYPQASDASHWFRGFLHEVLEGVPTAAGLHCVILRPQGPAYAGCTVVGFYVPGLDASAVAVWRLKGVGPELSMRRLLEILKGPWQSFTAVPEAHQLALYELRAVLNARARGARIADLLLTSCGAGAVVHFTQHARSPLRVTRHAVCASLESFLAQYPPAQGLAGTSRETMPAATAEKDEWPSAPPQEEEGESDLEEDEDTVELDIEEMASARRKLKFQPLFHWRHDRMSW
jgi:hypothetical protein